KSIFQLEVLMKTHVMKDIDQDWQLLIQEARIMGLHIDDVRRFLNTEKAVKKKTPMKNTIRQR
ncbi:hypothetical protein BB65665_03069, partial [Bacillus sp. 916]